ncbi:MAG: group II intron reverse transcriptase/maturase [Actinomycetota bacterium]|nr:group II intron reverse transcriptase/maturase [Actinomycetota bacterium]
MHDPGKSDGLVVPTKPPNNASLLAAEAVEERRPAKGNAASKTHPGHSAGPGAPSALDRVRQKARTDKKARLTALLHHVSVDRLREAYRALNPRAATGVDDLTWEDYGLDLEDNLRDLHARVHRGSYRAKPTRRAYIPKPDGRLRPLGVAALEDKILQRAVVEVLNGIYETDFLGFSYGFRPGRSAHDALDALAFGIDRRKVGWVLDADIRDFFGQLDHEWLMRFLEHRIADRRVLRLIQKWLAAGVIEDGIWSGTERGTAQGASASPLLANVYLHYVFDLWAHQWRTRRAHGEMIIVRYADDYLVGFEREQDARQFLADLRDRLAMFSLELAPEKTRLIQFGRFAARDRACRGQGKPETFDFLGFTHCCAKTKNGRFMLKRITIAKRMRRKLHELKDELRRRRHHSIPEQGRWLGSVLRGHYAYYAVPGNSDRINRFYNEVTRLWLRSLRRRSQRHQLPWTRMRRISARWLPPPKRMHPFPNARFAATTQGRSPVR